MLKFKSLPILAGMAVISALTLLSSPANAAQIFVQQSGTSAAGVDPNLIANSGAFVVGAAGSHTYQNPLLIIVGAYDGMGTPSISFSGCPVSGCPLATTGTYGLSENTGTLVSNEGVYTELNLNAQSSDQFDNWACGKNGCPGTGGDVGLGLAEPTTFSLYVFAVPTSLTSSITIDESGAARGSYIIAYSCEETGTGACPNGKDGSTPYTNAGLVAPAPAIGHGLPVLLAVGGILFGAKLGKRSSKRRSPGTAVLHAAA
jgi:hypothetical protein